MFPSFTNADTLREPFGAFIPFQSSALMRDAVALWPHGATKAFADIHKLQLDLFGTMLTLWLLPLSTVHDAPDPEQAVAPAFETAAPVEPAPPPLLVAAPAAPAAEPTAIAAPATLARPDAAPDDLQRINGIGPKLEKTLNGLGIWHFRQIAALSPDETTSLNEKIGFKGRIEREGWKAQASRLAKAARPPQAA